MGAIEDLAAALVGQQAQTEIAQSNPYLKFREVPDSLGQMAIGAAGKGNYSTNEIIAASLGSGLLSGLLDGFGQDYQNTLTNRYQTAVKDASLGIEPSKEGLSDSLWRSARDSGSIFNLKRSFESGLEKEKLEAKLIEKLATATNKRERDAVLSAMKAVKMDTRSFEGAAKEAEPIAVDADGKNAPKTYEKQMIDEMSKETLKLIEEGYTPSAAAEAVSAAYKGRRGELDRQYKRIEEAESSGDTLASLAKRGRYALENAGDTGLGGGIRNVGAKVLGVLGSDNQAQKAAAGDLLESLQAEVIAATGGAFKGPMSDRDVLLMLKSGPSLSNQEWANKEILDRWEYAANLQKQYAEFMREQRDTGVSVNDAEKQWRKIKAEQPYFVEGEGGAVERNPFWLQQNLLDGGSPEEVMAEKLASEQVDQKVAPTAPTSAVPAVGETFNGERVIAVKKIR